MNRTANYNLCQFEAGDQVQRTDFNEDNAKIDAAIAAEASARQSGDSSLSGQLSSLSSTVSGKASQSSLNTLKNQVAKLGNCQIHCFTYTGTGSSGTNGWTMQICREGVATAVVCIPLKYMHTPVETVGKADIEDTARLLAAFAAGLGEGDWHD